MTSKAAVGTTLFPACRHVLKKGEGKLNLDTIVKQFAKTSLSYSPNQNPSKLVLVVQEPDSSSNNFVPISQAMEYLRSPSSSAVSVQCFVPPRGGTDSGMFSNYRCEYLLDQYGRHVTRTRLSRDTQLPLTKITINGQR